MSESEAIFRLILAQTIPLALGMVIARAFLGSGRPLPVYVSHGFLLGVLCQIFTIRLFDATGMAFSFWPMLTLLAVTLLISVLAWRRQHPRNKTLRPPDVRRLFRMPAWQLVVALLLLLTATAHLWYAFSEIVLRPTYAWDAWSSWEPVTLQYFYNSQLRSELVTTSNHGSVSTLAQLWSMVALNDGNLPAARLPWLLCYGAIALSLYGAGKEYANWLWGSMLSVAFLTMPLVFTHTALPGYADIWTTLSFTLGILSVLELKRNGSLRVFFLVLAYAITCVITKRTGLGAGLIVLIVLALSYRKGFPKTFYVVLVGVAALALATSLALTGITPIDVSIGNHVLQLNPDVFNVPGLKPYPVNFYLDTTTFARAFVVFSSWHLLGGILLLCLIPGLSNAKRPYFESPTTIVGASVVLALIYFFVYFTILAPEAAVGDTGLSRALLSISATILLLFMLRFSEQRVAYDRNQQH